MTVDELREKVIKGFTCCDGAAVHLGHCQEDCPYFGESERADECVEKLHSDALSLLKAQEPRVITLVELWYMEHKPVFLQRKNSLLYMVEPAIVLKTERCYIPSLGDSYILMRENKIHDKYWACGYNVTWRCWTSRPTDEQRKAVKWE